MRRCHKDRMIRSSEFYDENKGDDDQIYKFFVHNGGDSLTTEEFDYYWLHMQVNHGDTYVKILENMSIENLQHFQDESSKL